MLQLSRATKSALTTALLLPVLILVVIPAIHRHSYGGSKSKQESVSKSQLASRSYDPRPVPMTVYTEESRNIEFSDMASTRQQSRPDQAGMNTLVVYAGRWKFLRILFPYVYRELRQNGGVLDRVWFMMVNYDKETHDNLVQLTQITNKNLNQSEEVFQLHFLGYPPGKQPPRNIGYTAPYYEMFAELMQKSSNRYFKIDDDIVYIHPATFKSMVERKNSQQCFLHSANIVTNWRCNIKHQDLGVYKTSKEVNPKNLTFEFHPNGNCGWKSPECAELTLRTFLHYYHKGQLDKYQFEGLELLNQRKRFSINFFLFDKDMINIKSMLEAGPIEKDDENWWSRTYAGKFKQPNCIVGGGLAVHFSYFPTYQKMLKSGLLREFEAIVQKEVGSLMGKELWRALKFPEVHNKVL